ncbi:hypothetical protein BBJ28_00016014 [Nothophytophthora sp. Chile5]|nr:hypothetical protein BBJ28_00016014 [Nothophytophthora sp. Chile5]
MTGADAVGGRSGASSEPKLGQRGGKPVVFEGETSHHGTGKTTPKQRRQLAYALHALKLYNPDFALTPEVLEIMRMFFADLRPDARGTISLGALFDEIERLDPDARLVSADTRRRMRRHMARRGLRDDRLDFAMFCEWVMRWKEINPMSVQNVYTSWAEQIAALDFGMSEGDSLFLELRPEDEPPNETLTMEIMELLQARQKLRGARQRHAGETALVGVLTASDSIVGAMAYEDYEASIAGYGIHPDDSIERDTTAESGEPEAGTAEPSSQKEAFQTVSKSFIAGGAAGIVAKSMLAPLDRVKILFQVNDKRKFSFRNAAKMARDIYVHDGFHALFRGNMLNILRVVPYAGLQHSGFDFFRRKFHAYNFRQAELEGSKELRKLSNLQLVTAGSLAGGLSLVVAYPLDIVRARYMVQQGKHRYRSLYEAVATMYKVDGVRSFSRGLVPSLLGTLPYTGIGFSLNERFKIWVRVRFFRRCQPVMC